MVESCHDKIVVSGE